MTKEILMPLEAHKQAMDQCAVWLSDKNKEISRLKAEIEELKRKWSKASLLNLSYEQIVEKIEVENKRLKEKFDVLNILKESAWEARSK